MTLKRRLVALETVRGGRGRLIVAIGPAQFDPAAELRHRRIDIARADTLVVIRKPADSSVSISVDGHAYWRERD